MSEDSSDSESKNSHGNGEVEEKEEESEEVEEKEEETSEPATTREKLAELGFYDNEFTEFPPELSAVKRFKAERNPDPIIEALKIDGFDVDFMKEEMIDALGRIGDKKAVDILKELADDSEMRHLAIEALGRIESPESIEKISNYLGPDARVNSHVRVKAAEALGRIGSIEGVSPLLDSIEDESAQVRSTAIMSLGEILEKKDIQDIEKDLDKDEILQTLNEVLEDEEKENVRLSAAETLKKMGGEKANSVLEQYRDDPNELVARVSSK